ncbi:MAG: hypothetical protein IIA67_03395 [Planctomycetes bacterium]|nr:hypothetical protein [Planctomycetota bacterium]
MNQRNQAIETLKAARDSLAEQLTERILECREEILDDARGDSFMGEIEQIYEKFGNRLSHLNSLISSLPAVVPGLPEKSSDARPAALPAPESKAEKSDETSSDEWGAELETDEAEPAADNATGEEPIERVTFETFVGQLRAADMQGAGETLGVLLGVGTDRGVICATDFAEKFVADPTVMLKAMNLRTELQAGNHNASLMLLWECFGLRGLESIGAMQTLKASLA